MGVRRFAILLALLVIPSTCWGQRARIPVQITTGWETTFYPLGEVSAASEIGEKGGEGLIVSYAVDRFWFVVPFWNGKGRLVLSPGYERGAQPDKSFEFTNQSSAGVSEQTGVSPALLVRPWSSYIPFGWPILVSIVALVNIFSGPSPLKKFQQIWAQPRYRAALAILFGKDDLARRDFPFHVTLPESPPDPEITLGELLPALEEDGISRQKADRDLKFAFRFLVENGYVILVYPDDRPSNPQSFESLSPGDPPAANPT